LIHFKMVTVLTKKIKRESMSRDDVDLEVLRVNINGRDVQRKNVVNNVDKSSLWAP